MLTFLRSHDQLRDAFLASDWLTKMVEELWVSSPQSSSYETMGVALRPSFNSLLRNRQAETNMQYRQILFHSVPHLALKTCVNGMRILCYISLQAGPTKARTIFLPALPEPPSCYINIHAPAWGTPLGLGGARAQRCPCSATALRRATLQIVPFQAPTKVL